MRLKIISEWGLFKKLFGPRTPRVPPPAPAAATWEYTANNPDKLFEPGSTTFIYTYGGKLFTAPHPTTHQQMYLKDPEVNQALFGVGNQVGHVGRDVASKHGLLGRISADHKTISLWNVVSDKGPLQNLLAALASRGLTDANAILNVPGLPAQTVHELLTGVKATGPVTRVWTPEERAKVHLMPSDEKKQAMKELGVGVGGKPHPMQQALDDAGLRVPGQKWWAMNSEEKDKGEATEG